MELFRSCDFSVLAVSRAKGKRDEREENKNSMDSKKNQSFGWRRNQKTFPKQKTQQLLTHKQYVNCSAKIAMPSLSNDPATDRDM